MLQQDWLILDLRDQVTARVQLPRTSVDAVLVKALGGEPVSRAVLVEALVRNGYSTGSAEVAIHRAPYLTSAGRGLLQS